MSKSSPKLSWCKARIGEDMNWWVSEISDPIRWDIDGLGIIDPKQFQYIIDLIEPLYDYGFLNEYLDKAFYSFVIEKIEADKSVHLKRTTESILDCEDQFFALPDVIDEEKGPYADFLDHVTKLRVKMLNATFEFAQKLTIEELEDDIREDENKDYMEGRATHFFSEITAILEYIPEGFEAEEESDEDTGPKKSPEPAMEEIPDIEESVDDDIEADDTMKWDEEEEEEEDGQSDKYEEPTTPPES
tara:strand:+ start:109 stop:843 length:735 start_codon:yes stop_codon:yes gene_type:complete